MKTTWQRSEVALHFLDERRRNLPYAEDQLQLLIRVVRHFFEGDGRNGVTRIVDLGCGDGVVARTLLSAYPEASAVLIDHSLPMLSRAQEAMAGARVEIVQHDLADDIRGVSGVRDADVIASAFAIHHLPTDRKQSLYGEIFDALAPGGMFVNIEHVASPTPRLEALFDDALIDSLVAGTGRPHAEIAAEYHARPDKADNRLDSVEEQTSWLRDIGYVEVDCHFKFLELAMFGGVKPA